LADFSGYIAADELYDGPFCVLSIVDNRTFKRLAYRVLDHDPTQDDITDFFQGFRAALDERGLAWIPTEGKLANNHGFDLQKIPRISAVSLLSRLGPAQS
jgi:hypothetical protein